MNFINKLYFYISIFQNNKNISFSYNKKIIHIDLCDSSNHFGDILFFGPLIQGFKDLDFKLSISDYYSFYSSLYEFSDPMDDSFIIFRSYDSKKINNYRKVPSSAINFYSSSPMPISKWLYNMFLKCNYESSLEKFIINLKNKSSKKTQYQNLPEIFNSEYVIFSPFINSRKIGFFPPKCIVNKQILDSLNYYKSINKKIILVGQNSFSSNPILQKYSSYIDFDFTGKTNIFDLVNIINSSNCISVLSYDTLTYHLAFLLDKPVSLFSKSWLSRSEYKWIASRFTPAF